MLWQVTFSHNQTCASTVNFGTTRHNTSKWHTCLQHCFVQFTLIRQVSGANISFIVHHDEVLLSAERGEAAVRAAAKVLCTCGEVSSHPAHQVLRPPPSRASQWLQGMFCIKPSLHQARKLPDFPQISVQSASPCTLQDCQPQTAAQLSPAQQQLSNTSAAQLSPVQQELSNSSATAQQQLSHSSATAQPQLSNSSATAQHQPIGWSASTSTQSRLHMKAVRAVSTPIETLHGSHTQGPHCLRDAPCTDVSIPCPSSHTVAL